VTLAPNRSATLGGTSLPGAQTSSVPARPTFAGTWTPSDPARSDAFFDNGLGWIPAKGRLMIEQRPNRLTIATHVPDDILDRLLAIHKRWDLTVAYAINDQPGCRGGWGRGGDQCPSSWHGARLLLAQTQAGVRLITVWLSMDSDRLKKTSHTVIASDRQAPVKESTVEEWFDRAK
jgi:hypothetical protein